MLTDKNGSDVGQFLYSPFGEMWVEEASTVDISHITRFFTNQQYDKESGLYYYNARYYDPHLGSFITPDPAMDGLNHYNYCNSNPINYTDPTGLSGGYEPGNESTYDATGGGYVGGGSGSNSSNNNNSSNNSSSDNYRPTKTPNTPNRPSINYSNLPTTPTNPYYNHPSSDPYVPIDTPTPHNEENPRLLQTDSRFDWVTRRYGCNAFANLGTVQTKLGFNFNFEKINSLLNYCKSTNATGKEKPIIRSSDMYIENPVDIINKAFQSSGSDLKATRLGNRVGDTTTYFPWITDKQKEAGVDATILAYNTSNGGKHFIEGDKFGNPLHDSDPNAPIIGSPKIWLIQFYK